MINPFLIGSNIYLRGLELNDAEGNYPFWLNDQSVNSFNTHGRLPYDKSQAIDYITSTIGSNKNLILAIVDKKTDNHIGNISLQSIDYISRSAEFAILIGEKTFFGKGIGYEAASLIIDHGFKTLNLHRIGCGTSSENIAMQKLAIKLGMKEEGIRKDAIFKNGNFFDILEYGLIK